jgi:D-arabinose 1-dehydrogenase-like Zn-dependent alcohol dehydrogenase
MEYPRIPGHEVIGIVEKLGDGVTEWRVGQRVGVGWSGGGDKVTGLTVDGGYAEFAVANTSAVVAIPEGVPAHEAAPLMCAGITTFSALRASKARVRATSGVPHDRHFAWPPEGSAREGARCARLHRW